MDSAHPETFGATLRWHRERAGLSQEALAERAGLTRNAISALERGERQHPYAHTIRALSTALELDLAQHERLVVLARARGEPPPEQSLVDLEAIATSVSAASVRHPAPRALPTPPNALVGREAECMTIAELLANPACRLVTISGPGGVGKTRLALQIAADLSRRFDDGVAWVPLAGVANPAQVPDAIADALGLSLQGARPPGEQVIDLLSAGTVLLILDNLEHLMQAAPLLSKLLEHAPGVRLLVTSRERLQLAGEWVVDLKGLPLTSAVTGTEATASQLFVERARQRTNSFTATGHDQALVARICALVEGIPLGIELAAAWVGTLSLAEIAEELARNLDFLTATSRDVPDRHRSLHAVFDHSWKLLSVEEREVYARLAVFRGGFSREAATAVAGASLSLLAALVNKSLVRWSPGGAAGRYDLHELPRQYALVRLDADREAGRAARATHAGYFAVYLGGKTQALEGREAYQAWTEIAADLDNVRAAWEWAVACADHQLFAQMGRAMHIICGIRGLFEEGVSLFGAAATALRARLASAPELQSAEIAWTLGHILSLYGNRAARSGRFGEARDRLRESYQLLEQRNDLLAAGGTLFFLGYMSYILGDYADAHTWFTRSADLAHAHGNSYFAAASESLLALLALAQNIPGAGTRARAAIELWRVNGQPNGLATGYWSLSVVLHASGAGDEAEDAAREALRLAAGVQDRWVVGLAFLQLGVLALGRDDSAGARYLVDESLALFDKLGNPESRGRALVTRGWVAHAAGDSAEAERWFQQAWTLASATELEPVRLDAQYGLAVLMAGEASEAALAFLDQVVAHPATAHPTRERAIRLESALRTQRPFLIEMALPYSTDQEQ